MLRADALVTLKKLTYPIVAGVTTPTLSETGTVWGKVRSVTGAEYYDAQRSGYKVDLIAAIYAFEYEEEQVVTVAGEDYDVVRRYRKSQDVLELTCARRGGK